MTPSAFAAAVRNRERVFGTCITSTSPKFAAEVPKIGVDFVFIDTEHIPIDRAELAWMCTAFHAMDIATIVRVPAPDHYEVCKAVDAGACGVMAPYIETEEQVRALVSAVKYKPLKGRLLEQALSGGPVVPETQRYMDKLAQNRLVFINIESRAGINNMDRLLSVPGVDGVIIGPHDLSVNLGIPEAFERPEFGEAIEEIIQKAHACGKAAGNHYSFGIEREEEWIRKGMDIIIHSTDLAAFVSGIGTDIARLRRAGGQKTAKPGAAEIV